MNPFETDAEAYDEWFDRHEAAYLSELSAVRAAPDAILPGCDQGGFMVLTGIKEAGGAA
jgi:hypothetical protein